MSFKIITWLVLTELNMITAKTDKKPKQTYKNLQNSGGKQTG